MKLSEMTDGDMGINPLNFGSDPAVIVKILVYARLKF